MICTSENPAYNIRYHSILIYQCSKAQHISTEDIILRYDQSKKRKMIKYTNSETVMWNIPPKVRVSHMSIPEINEKYERGEQRIVTETNREKLPNFVSALNRKEYMQLRPFYQRRSRWDVERQSKLIESFIINIPVPPVFLYEKAYDSYEVMDGQQRITAISEFYNNKFKLRGLDLWPELNGMLYTDLPNKIRSGLDRRSISSIVLLKESAPNEEDAIFLRQLVFERLNTGGVKLERQEIRNSLGSGVFNDMMFEISREDVFRETWELPLFTPEELTNNKLSIYDKSFYKKMEDIEVILRFFAFRHMKYFRYGIQGFLDLYMIRSKRFDESDCNFLKDHYLETLGLAQKLYKEKIFRTYEKGKFSGKPKKGIYDAVMVSLSKYIEHGDKLLNRADLVITDTIELFETKGVSAMTGRASTKKDFESRIQYFDELFKGIVTA